MNSGILRVGSGLLLLALLWIAPGAAADEAGLEPAALKDMAVGDGATLTLAGHWRTRFEGWSDFAFSAADGRDDNFVLVRGVLSADLRWESGARVFVEAKSAGAGDRDLPGGRRSIDVDRLDLQQAYVELSRPLGDGEAAGEIAVLVGRQALAFGKQRLISPLPWANSLRAWDGARVVVRRRGWRGDAFFARFAVPDSYAFNDWQGGHSLWGLYASGPAAPAGDTLDLYYLGFAGDDPVTVNGTTGEDTRHTLGARWDATRGAVDVELEGGYQLGEVGRADVSAWFLAADLGHTWRDVAWRPRLHLGFDAASGDDRFADDSVETFHQLLPLGHAYLGYMDFVGRQNVIDLHPGLRVHPSDRLSLRTELHLFRRASDADGLYNAGGGLLRGGGLTRAREIGRELNLVVTFQLNPLASLEAGYGHFFAGDFLEESGPAEDVDWLYLQALFRF